MKYYTLSSAWAGKYAKTYWRIYSKPFPLFWYLKYSFLEFIRVLKLNKHHYGNIFCIGERLTDKYGRR